MPFQAKFTDDDLISYLKKFGGDITTDQIRSFADSIGVQIQSVHKRMSKLPQFSKAGRGKWNLTLAQKLEQVYRAPASANPLGKSEFLLNALSTAFAIL